MAEPQVITLNNTNSLEILSSYIDVAQKAGTFTLPESDILKRCRDVLLKNASDSEINTQQAKNLFIQAIVKGQSKGAYTLDDASILHKVCQFVSQNINQPVQPSSQPEQVSSENSDLEQLSAPVPLRSVPRTI